jgi:hypothetical protein
VAPASIADRAKIVVTTPSVEVISVERFEDRFPGV